MTLEIRPADDFRRPRYPGIDFDVEFARRRYSGSILDRMRSGLTRPLVVLGLYASMSLPAAGQDRDERRPIAAGAEPRLDVDEVRGRSIKMLTASEIASLVGDLETAQTEAADAIKGQVAGQAGFLTEEEGRAVLRAFFEKNGFAIEDDVEVRQRFVRFTADGFDRRRGVGFEFLGAKEGCHWQFEPVETDLSPEEITELELARTRSGEALLVLDGSTYAYNKAHMDHLPTKAQVVDRLLDDVRRFAVWVAQRKTGR